MSHKHRIQVSEVVLGDVGRSPRMQYHALALASSLADVDVIGYAGSAVHPSLREHKHISWHFLRLPALLDRHDPPRWLFLGSALLKVFGECLQLLWLLLFVVHKPDVILVQNPPAIPTLLVAFVVARVRAARLVVDWHNFGYTMLSLRLGQHHPIVRLAQWYERVVGQRADGIYACRGPCKRRYRSPGASPVLACSTTGLQPALPRHRPTCARTCSAACRTRSPSPWQGST